MDPRCWVIPFAQIPNPPCLRATCACVPQLRTADWSWAALVASCRPSVHKGELMGLWMHYRAETSKSAVPDIFEERGLCAARVYLGCGGSALVSRSAPYNTSVGSSPISTMSQKAASRAWYAAWTCNRRLFAPRTSLASSACATRAKPVFV